MFKRDKTDYVARAGKALAEGKLWKAKEILQGNVAATKFDPALYEQYGLVLLEMGDLVEAGKYLFLAGKSKPEHIKAIDLYLSRHARHGWQNIYGTFPARAKLLDLSEYPESVAHELRRLGYPEEERRKLNEARVVTRPKTLKDRLLDALAVTLGLFILLCFLVGVGVVIKTVIGWVF
jgi:tetratricopeptide (TPR) repeat protein